MPAAAAAALLLALAACSGSSGAQDAPATTSPGAADATGIPTTGGTSTASATGTEEPSSSTPPGELPVIAERATTINEDPAVVQLNEVRVSGRLMTVTLTVANPAAAGGPDVTPGGSLSNGRLEAESGSNLVDGRSVDGIYVLDTAAGTRHLVARDAQGVCVCSQGDVDIPPGGAVSFSATFSAPGDDVDVVDVVVPTAGAFPGVPVTR